ncbi:MAG: heme o synthase [Geminicoccaceae bacterium]
MATPERVIGIDARVAGASEVRDYWLLLKPNVMSLVVFSGTAGLYLAPGSLHPVLVLTALLCMAAGAGASAAINNGYDADIDRIMPRTRRRPTATGRIAPSQALTFGAMLAVASVTVMGLAVNGLAAALLALTVAFYVLVYTMWLKRRTPQNIVIGGAAGALPPLIGWAAVTGNVSLAPVILFLIIFFWTPPHFWALALYRTEDYAAAGVPMLPVVAGTDTTRRHILTYTALLVPLALAPVALGFAGVLYAAVASALGVGFLVLAVRLWRDGTQRTAMQTFRYSIVYLFGLFAALMLDKALAVGAPPW